MIAVIVVLYAIVVIVVRYVVVVLVTCVQVGLWVSMVCDSSISSMVYDIVHGI